MPINKLTVDDPAVKRIRGLNQFVKGKVIVRGNLEVVESTSNNLGQSA